MSQQALDEIIRKACADPEFRGRLFDPAAFEPAISGFELTSEEVEKIRRLVTEKKGSGLPFAEGLGERLSK